MKRLKDIFNWNDPKLFSMESIIRRSIVFSIVVISNILIAIESFGVLISDDLLQGYYAIDHNRKLWVGSIFLMGVATVPPIFCFFSSRFTTKTCFSIGLVIFMMGGFFGGLCTNYYLLLLFRLVTGFGAGIIMMGSGVILKRIATTSLHPMMLSFSSNLFGLGIFIGMIIGGIIGQSLNWRLVFFLDAILCGIALIFIWTTFKQIKEFTPRTKIDWIAYIYFLGFIACFATFFSQVKEPWNTLGWRSDFSFALALSAVIFFALLLMRCHRSANPLINLTLFKNKSFTLLCLASFLVGFTMFGCLISYIFLLIGFFEYEHITTGLVLSIYGISVFISGMLAFFVKGVKPIFFILLGLSCIVISFFINHALTIQSEPIDIIQLMILRGVGTGFCMQPIINLVSDRVPEESGPDALKTILIFRQFAACVSASFINVITVMREAYHSLRFGEEVDIYSGRFRQYVRQFQLYAETSASENWEEAASRAKKYIIDNVRLQSHIASFDDALFIFAWIIIAVIVCLGLNELLIYIRETRLGRNLKSL